MVVTRDTSLREPTVNDFRQKTGSWSHLLHFRQLCFISFQKAWCGPLCRDHCFKAVTVSLQIVYGMPQATDSTGCTGFAVRLGAGPSPAAFTATHSNCLTADTLSNMEIVIVLRSHSTTVRSKWNSACKTCGTGPDIYIGSQNARHHKCARARS